MSQLSKDTKDKIAKYVLKPAIAGLVGTVAAAVVLRESGGPLYAFGSEYNAPLFAGGMCAVSNIGASLAHDYVLPHIPHNEKFINSEAALLAMAASGGSIYVAGILTGLVEPSNFIYPIALGAGAQIASDYAYENFVGPYWESM